jgi:phosphatidylinositol glycan class B
VFFYYLFSFPLKEINPFYLATFLRILTSFLSLVSLLFLTRTVFSFLKGDIKKNYWLIFVNLIWFVPFINARTSSENFSMIFFFIGLDFFLREDKKFLSGVLLGLSFISRFQMGLFILPLFLHRLVFKKRWEGLAALGVLVSIGLGVLVDFWGYGEWVFTPWKYFWVNLVEGKAADFGVSPWWFYFQVFFLKREGVVAIILFFATVRGWIKDYKNPLSLMGVFYFGIHIMLSHKEPRFLIPLFFLSIYHLADMVPEIAPMEFFKRKFPALVTLVNLVCLTYIIFLPLREEDYFKKYLFNNENKMDFLLTGPRSPYHLFLREDFYKPFGLLTVNFPNHIQLGFPHFFATDDSILLRKLGRDKNCEARYPENKSLLRSLIFKKGNNWGLFYCLE